jgi:hypothetical protein
MPCRDKAKAEARALRLELRAMKSELADQQQAAQQVPTLQVSECE